MRETAPCGLDSAPHDAAGRRRSTPLLPGAWEFCSEATARNAALRQGKISVERRRRNATRAKASGCASREAAMGEAVSPKGIHANNVRPNRATVAGGNHRRDQGRGVNLTQRHAVRLIRILASSRAWRLGWHGRAAPISSSSSPDGARIVGATTVETGWPVRAVRRYGSGVSRVATPHIKRGGSVGGDREL